MSVNKDDAASYIVISDKNKVGHVVMQFEPGDTRIGTTFGLCCENAKENIEVVRIGGSSTYYFKMTNFGGGCKEVTDPQELINMCQTGDLPLDTIDEFNASLAKAQEEIEAEKNVMSTD